MKKSGKMISVAAIMWVLICFVLTLPEAFAWGDNGGGRESHTLEEINSGVLGDSIVFNSISDSTIGDEKNFVGARENTGVNAGIANVWHRNEIDVEDGKEYLIRLYVHNNSPLGLDAVSENTRVAFSIPTESGKQIEVNGFIFSDNAVPSEYWDYVHFNSDHTFHLEYIYGSAIIENNGFASKANGGSKPLSDEIVTAAASKNGVAIGYEALDGRIPGCYAYASYICIRVKVVYDYEFAVDTGVCRTDNGIWKDEITAAPGDQLEFYITYTNTSDEPHNAVTLQDAFPDEFSFLDGTIIRQGAETRNINRDDLNGGEILLGDFDAGESAQIVFRAKVANGENQGAAVNWANLRVGNIRQTNYMAVNLSTSEPAWDAWFTISVGLLALLFLVSLAGAIQSGLYLWRNRASDKGQDKRPKNE